MATILKNSSPDWDFLFKREWQTMGLTKEPEIFPALENSKKPFPYSVITPATKDRLDAESLVFVLMGDGFTASQEDRAKWRYYCQYFTRALLNYKPFKEFKNVIKVYRIDVVSNESGITRAESPDGRSMPGKDPKDTYFGGYLWALNMARLIVVKRTSAAKALAKAYVPNVKNISRNIILNTELFGGSGGEIAYGTVCWAFLDLLVHEMTHQTGLIPDEYLYAGSYQRDAAFKSFSAYSTVVHRKWINDPKWQAWSPWHRMLGKDGITFDPWLEGVSANADYANVFRPTGCCKMRYLGSDDVFNTTGEEEHPLCEICCETWRDRMCLISKTPVLHFQPYNDQFYDNAPVALNDKHFVLRIPQKDDIAGERHCQKVYAEQLFTKRSVKGIRGELKMTVRDAGGAALYENVAVDTKMDLSPGIYTVEAKFEGLYKSAPYSLALAGVENKFEVKKYTIIKVVGKYAEPWNSEDPDKLDSLTRSWKAGVASVIPKLEIDPSCASLNQFDIKYSWHVRNFDGSAGPALGSVGTYGGPEVKGPVSAGQFVLRIQSHDVINDYPFDITIPYRAINHYPIDAQTYSHESRAHDMRGITIIGEGFSEAEQDKFNELAEDFITKFLDTDPIKRISTRFCFFIQNAMSPDSGITKPGVSKNTHYGFMLNADGSVETYREDLPMELIIRQEVSKRDTNQKTWSALGATVVLINESGVQSNYNWRNTSGGSSVHLATIQDAGYQRLIESMVTHFAHARTCLGPDILETYRWMDGKAQNKTFEETLERLVESCYSHEMWGKGDYNLPRPVVVSDAAVKTYYTDGEKVLNWDIADRFKAYSYGHEITTNTTEADTFTYRYFTDKNHRVGDLLDGPPIKPGFYWIEADLPTGPKFYAKTHTDRYGFMYKKGMKLKGVNGTGTSPSSRVRGFVRIELQHVDNRP